MSSWHGKSRGTKLGYRIVIFVCRNFGVFPAYLLLRFIALYFFRFSWNSSRPVYSYFRNRLQFNRIKSLRFLYRNYYVFAQTLLDKIIVLSGIPNPFTFEFEKEENLRAIVANGKGGLLLSAHIGNWEVAGHFLNGLGVRVSVVMYDGEHQQIKNYLDDVTGGRKFNVIVVKNDLSHVYAIGEALQNNELVCMHADRFLPGNKTIKFPLLGKEAQFPIGPFALAYTFKVPVSFVFAFKETSNHYHFYGCPMIRFEEDASRQAVVENLMRRFTGNVEELLNKYPEHWFNYYNFWEIDAHD